MTQADVIAQLQRGTTTVFALARALDGTTSRVEQILNTLIAKGMVEQGPLGGYRLVDRRVA